jgi:hypothetical protein
MAGRSLGAIAAAALLFLYLIKLWRRVAPRFARGERYTRVAYRAELDRLSELGMSRKRGESREAFAARLGQLVPSFRPLTAVHVGVRFGSEQAKRKPKSELEAIVERLDQERRAAFRPARRLWAVLSPFSWLKAR